MLRVYPLESQGLLKQLISSMLGESDIGMWHTSIEVYDTEYYFQNGIRKAIPGTTVFGTPSDIHYLGNTDIPKIVFEDFLSSSLADKFSPQKYHLLKNNCNNFSNALSLYLVEKEIPEYILKLQQKISESKNLTFIVDTFFNTQ